MCSLEKASTGLPGLDSILHGLRLGDNVVWQVQQIKDYKYFVEPFVKRALAKNQKVVYLRFGQHEEVVAPHPQITRYNLNPDVGFEAFSTRVHAIVSEEGEGTYYVFDSLSDLLTSWATDLMIGNFFRVTCPFLHELNTIAYFAVLRNRNSYQTIARIRETTQLLLDIFRQQNYYYVHPLKVMGRYSPTMFLPHISSQNDFVPLTSSVEAARFFSLFQKQTPGDAKRKLDYWDRVFLRTQNLLEGLQKGEPGAKEEEKEMRELLYQMLIGRDKRILSLARKNLNLQDMLNISRRLIGSGNIGGKAAGMLLARSILKNSKEVDWDKWLEPHDSFYIGADVYYTYLVENGCWHLRLKQKQKENYFDAAAELREKILAGILPDFIREQFIRMLEYYGQSPIIVRSSSLLEDGFGNAFAGKYESVFCVNQGDLEERYNFFEKAIKRVYASSVSEDALAYRLQRGLAESDEQMAVLVQRVSGSYRSRFFFPDLAGVAMSRNPYVWRKDLDARAGMMRLVFGLGTRAVERVEDDYPRVIALDKPLLRPDSTWDDIRRFSQHKIDVLDVSKNSWDTIGLSEIAEMNGRLTCWDLVAVCDDEKTEKLKKLGRDRKAWVLTFEKLMVETDICELMKKMLQHLEESYEHPVDVEFTVNFGSNGEMQINLLQCRPLQTIKRAEDVKGGTKPGPSSENILFSSYGRFMGAGIYRALRKIIYIQPEGYASLSTQEKYQVARLIGKLNWALGHSNSPFMLIGPGRWGTSTPSLGVPVSFSEICNTAVLVEVAACSGSYFPELSFGTHFFQDLVEADIFYVALFPGQEGVQFNENLLCDADNSFALLFPDYSEYAGVIKFIDLDMQEKDFWIYADLQSQQVTAYFCPVQEKGGEKINKVSGEF